MRFFVLALVSVAALTAATVRLVNERNRSVQLGYEMAAATRVQRALEEELRQLRIDRAALLDPKRLAPLAREQGLRTPSPDEIVVVHLAGEASDGR
ncbi:MAG: cell division protein FtsL [Myxococcales bacterium]|nr:cell division protein FtsL [Myxococcales bacterium]